MRLHCLVFLLLLATPALAQPVPVGEPTPAGNRRGFPGVGTIQADRIKCDLGYLSSDSLEGRGSGAKGGYRAGEWLALQLGWMGLKPGGTQSFHQPFSANGRRMRNVLATIPGKRSGEAVVIGAHYDHCGLGDVPGAGGRRGQIHNGADDNGSGTTALLQIARAFALSGVKHQRRVVFAFFDGEERGLLGSKHWVGSPTVRDRVVLMINLDMIGRLRGSVSVSYSGGQKVRGYLDEANRYAGLQMRFSGQISSGSDHYPFYRNRIPVIFPFTGFHDQYHKPSDDLDTINADGISKIARLAYCVAYQALNDASTASCAKDDIPAEEKPFIDHGQRPEVAKPPKAEKPRARAGIISHFEGRN